MKNSTQTYNPLDTFYSRLISLSLGIKEHYLMIIREVLRFIGKTITFPSPIIDEDGISILSIELYKNKIDVDFFDDVVAIDNTNKRWLSDSWSSKLTKDIVNTLFEMGYIDNKNKITKKITA